jgi:hypothetical protein
MLSSSRLFSRAKNVVPNYSSITSFLLHGEGANGSTSFVDSTGQCTFSNNGCSISTAQFKFGSSSISFNGNNRITSNSSALLNPSGDFTIEAWMYFTALPSGGVNWDIFNFTGGASFNPILQLWGDGTFLLRNAQTSGTIIQVGHGLAANTWYHIALTHLGTNFKIFKNGTQLGSGSNAGIANENKLIYIGATTAGYGFRGYMDEIRMIKGQAIYTTNFSVPTTPFS